MFDKIMIPNLPPKLVYPVILRATYQLLNNNKLNHFIAS